MTQNKLIRFIPKLVKRSEMPPKPPKRVGYKLRLINNCYWRYEKIGKE